MNYSIKIYSQAGQPVKLQVSGHLNIQNAAAIRTELLECLGHAQEVQLEIMEVEAMDLSFIQLLLSLKVSLQHVDLQLGVNPNLQMLIRTSGIEERLSNNALI